MKTKLITIPDELFDRITLSADENDRSVNGEITNLLKRAINE